MKVVTTKARRPARRDTRQRGRRLRYQFRRILRFCQELFRCAQRSTRDDSVVARNELLETLGDIRCERSDGDAARTLLLRTVAPRATRRYTGGRAGGKAETTTGLRGA